MKNSSTLNEKYLHLYFQVHQPKRLKAFSFFDIGSSEEYFDEDLNRDIVRGLAKECYNPTNLLLLRLIRKYPQLRVTFSISGLALEQLEAYAPSVIETFKMLASTGAVDFLGETYYHSLSFLTNRHEFTFQVEKHRKKIIELFGITPVVFRNTELIYANHIGRAVQKMSFKGVVVEGVDSLLEDRSVHDLFVDRATGNLRLFPRDYRRSDDIAFRFSDRNWKDYPVTARKFMHWLLGQEGGELITLGMDYETFGGHHKASSGIFTFLEEFLVRLAGSRLKPVNAREALGIPGPVHPLSVPEYTSWADSERDLSAWLGNDMQQDAFETLSRLALLVQRAGEKTYLETWRFLQASDHFYYMSTKQNADGQVHNFFSHYPSPHEAFINYMNVLADFRNRLELRRTAQRVQRVQVSRQKSLMIEAA